MDKTSEKVTKDPRRIERGKKLYETRMKRLKEQILQDNQVPTLSTSSCTGSLTPSTSSHTTRSNNSYVYGIGVLVVLAIGACVLFTYNTSQAKKLINDRLIAQHEQKQPPKGRQML